MRTTARLSGVLVATLWLAMLVGCVGGATTRPSDPAISREPEASTSGTPAAPASPSPTPGGPDKLLVIVEENRSLDDVARHMPFLASLSVRFGSATNYYAVAHPSLPNYLAIAGGSGFGIRDDRRPAAHRLPGPSVFGQLLGDGRTAKTYAEAMVGTCITHDQGRYAVRHNPWTYFTDPQERAECRRFDVPAGTPQAGQLAADTRSGHLPTFGLLVPDVCNDGHDCATETADAWLRRWLPVLQAGPDYQSGRLTIVVTWDEDDHTSNNHIACVVIHRSLRSRTVEQRLDHLALSAAASGIGGQPPLRDARSAPDLLQAFGLR